MSFKVKYSRLMVSIISKCRHEQQSIKARIPRAPLWDCLPQAWDNVSVSCIRNCFARVPVLPEAARQALKNSAFDMPDNELHHLQAELLTLYPERNESIKAQTDYGMLAFLLSVTTKGPTLYIDKFIDRVIEIPIYKPFFTTDRKQQDGNDLDDELSDEG